MSRGMLYQSGDSRLRSLSRDLLRQVRHPEEIGIEKIAEWIKSGPKGDRELAVKCAGAASDGRSQTQELIVR